MTRLVFQGDSSVGDGCGARGLLLLRRVRGVDCRLALRGQLVRVLFRKMTAHDAAADRADYRVMARVVAGDAAHQRALETPLGLGGGRRGGGRQRQSGGGENCVFHESVPLLRVPKAQMAKSRRDLVPTQTLRKGAGKGILLGQPAFTAPTKIAIHPACAYTTVFLSSLIR